MVQRNPTLFVRVVMSAVCVAFASNFRLKTNKFLYREVACFSGSELVGVSAL